MIDSITAGDISNEVSMMRSAFKGTILIVEGVTDSRLYGKFTERDDVRILIAYSKDNVKRSVSECVTRRRDHKVIGIVDSDLDRMSGKEYSAPLFVTDKRDLESTIMSSDALSDVLTEYSDSEAISQFEDRFGHVSEVIVKAAYPIGLLMFISIRDGACLCFKDLDYDSFVDRRSLRIDTGKMIDEVFSHSMNRCAVKKELIDSIQAEEELMDDPWQATRGHDLVSILTIGLNQIFGSYNSRGMKDGQVSGALRLAYSYDDFSESDLFRDTSEWSAKTGNVLWITRS